MKYKKKMEFCRHPHNYTTAESFHIEDWTRTVLEYTKMKNAHGDRAKVKLLVVEYAN